MFEYEMYSLHVPIVAADMYVANSSITKNKSEDLKNLSLV